MSRIYNIGEKNIKICDKEKFYYNGNRVTTYDIYVEAKETAQTTIVSERYVKTQDGSLTSIFQPAFESYNKFAGYDISNKEMEDFQSLGSAWVFSGKLVVEKGQTIKSALREKF